MLTWKAVLEQLQKCTPEQLEMPVVALIDAEPWEAAEFKIARVDPEDQYSNSPYLTFE